MLVALVIDGVIGWPSWLYRRIGHPVSWLGTFISVLDHHLNREEDISGRRRAAGIAMVVIVVGLATVAAYLAQVMLPDGWPGILLTGVLAWPLLASRSLYEHVAEVLRPLREGDLASARVAASMIVGRDTSALNEAGVSRATLESLAENTSDGVVAPLFWGALLGLPGIAAYKAINTLDSMTGHRTARHEAFGWASAKTDDIANFVPARLTGVFFALVSSRPLKALSCMMRDAQKHRSPNAGWPEAALAGGMGVRLSGPRDYGGKTAQEPWLNPAGRDPEAIDIQRGLQLYSFAVLLCAVVLLFVCVLALVATR